MLQFIKKFILDIMPSVVATIIGAYIVHHYVIPAATPDKPAAAALSSADPKPATPDAPADKPSFVKGVAEKAAIEKTATDSAPADSKKRHVTNRPAKSEQTASIPESATEERRDANGLARAAIERLRPPAEPPRSVAVVAPVQPPMPALPPAVTLPPPSPEVFNAGTGAIIRPVPPVTPTRSADASRPLPPENIPAAPPLELHDDIVTTATGRATTVADDVVSVAKSVIHAVLPLK